MDDTKADAVRLAYQFGFSVIPMSLTDKKPIRSWKRYQTCLPSIRAIQNWPASNLAIVTGEISGIVVVDCESDEDGRWAWNNLGNTPMVARSRRGIHLYFRHPGQPVRNAQRVCDSAGRSRYDIRGDGGYVLAPPSRYGEKSYKWKSGPLRPEQLPIFETAWRPPTATRAEREIGDGQAYIAKIRAIGGQGGHNDTYRAVCRLQAAELTSDEALAVMIEWNQTNADPPWSLKDLLHKVRSVYGGSGQ